MAPPRRSPAAPPSPGPRTWPRPGPAPWLLRSLRLRQVRKQETWGFPACGLAVGLWLMISSLARRRLVLNHARGTYHFSIQGRTVCQGPMHLVYVRLALSSDGEARRGRRPGRVCRGEGASPLPRPRLWPPELPAPGASPTPRPRPSPMEPPG